MEGISRKDLNRISMLLTTHVSTDESIQLAGKLTEFNFIPKMYAYTYLKRFYKEIKDIKTTEIDELPIEELDGLKLQIISKANLSGIKELLFTAFEREKYICDFDDTHNPSTKFGKCESDYHDTYCDEDGNDVPRPDELLTLVLMPDEFNKKYDDYTAEYWCSRCCDEAECDTEVSCDMDIGE